MGFDLYSALQQNLIVLFLFFLFCSFYTFQKGKHNFTFLLVLLAAASLFSLGALLDPFLNIWDERFHALVAKNLMQHPLRPTLYDNPIVTMPYDRWDRYTLWLHKQPLFLWQIAISFKLFGISEFTLRLPNIVLGISLVAATYRSAKILFDSKVAFYGSILILTCTYILELIAGRQELDHNDFTFLVYISLSIWAWIEYTYSGNRKWLILIGLFSGCAILCKWLVGLLVYLGWAVNLFILNKFNLVKYKDLFIALIITIIIALPWQLLTFIWYPDEAAKAYLFNAAHVTEPLDGHVGTFWYYTDKFNDMYGKIAAFFIIPAVYLSYKKINNKGVFAALITMVIVVYLFFSFVATKMPSFTVITAMPVMIAFGVLINNVLTFLEHQPIKKSIFSFLFILLSFILILIKLNFYEIAKKHSPLFSENYYSIELLKNRNNFKTLNLPPKAVLFNVNERHYIEAMFYTDATAYNFIPTEIQIEEVLRKGYQPIVYKNEKDSIPDYISKNKLITVSNSFINSYY
jgi:4-amino-4-deoxy-L-arabinose transferase-like glycosyltransferase